MIIAWLGEAMNCFFAKQFTAFFVSCKTTISYYVFILFNLCVKKMICLYSKLISKCYF